MLKTYKKEENFNEIIKNKVVVDFFATWCGPCKMLMPVLEKCSSDINIVKVDIDEFPDLAREYGVMSVPTLILFENGQELERKIGFLSEEEFRTLVTK